jgi:hypothetical protein
MACRIHSASYMETTLNFSFITHEIHKINTYDQNYNEYSFDSSVLTKNSIYATASKRN